MERLINFYTEIDALARRAMPKGQRRRRTGGRADEYSAPSNGGGHAPELGGVPGAAVYAAMGARRAQTGIPGRLTTTLVSPPPPGTTIPAADDRNKFGLKIATRRSMAGPFERDGQPSAAPFSKRRTVVVFPPTRDLTDRSVW